MFLRPPPPDPRDDYRSLLPPPGVFPSAPSPPVSAPAVIFALVLSFIAAMAAFASYLLRTPGWIAPILIAVPPVALALGAKYRTTMTLGLSEPPLRRISLIAALYVGFGALAVVSWRQFHPLRLDTALAVIGGVSLVCGAGLTALILRIDGSRDTDGGMTGLGFVLASLWSAGLLIQLNGAFGVDIRAQTRVAVVARYAPHKDTQPYVLDVLYPGQTLTDSKSVEPRVFRSAGAPRARICSIVRRGLLHITWERLDDCR